jgi:phenylpropionate dioxygenase-like ring-hydroxylating dioxygenase large terminal subunit
MSRFPFTSYPKGWFTVAWSSELLPGDVKPLRYFGKDLVLFRTASGEPRVLDAHCPHLGAHLGHGGKVDGESLVCPFHAWRFDSAGQCVEIPYAKRIPPRAQVACWPSIEKNGVVMVWHDAAGGPPAFQVPDVEYVKKEGWLAEEAHAEWVIRSHIQELVENAVDQSHFRSVHRLPSAEIFELQTEGQRMHMRGRFVMEEGKPAATLEWHFTGISFGVVHTENPDGIENSQILMYTPIDEDTVHVRFTTLVKKVKNDELTRRILRATNDETIRLFNQDIDIWQAKIYRERPQLAQGDGEFMKYRRWAAQFYLGHSANEAMPEERAQL